MELDELIEALAERFVEAEAEALACIHTGNYKVCPKRADCALLKVFWDVYLALGDEDLEEMDQILAGDDVPEGW